MYHVMQKLCDTLDGWNFHSYKNQDKYGDDILFDFYTKDGSAILTMKYSNGTISITNDVEYWNEKHYTDYENITLNEYNERLKEDN